MRVSAVPDQNPTFNGGGVLPALCDQQTSGAQAGTGDRGRCTRKQARHPPPFRPMVFPSSLMFKRASMGNVGDNLIPFITGCGIPAAANNSARRACCGGENLFDATQFPPASRPDRSPVPDGNAPPPRPRATKDNAHRYLFCNTT